MPPSSPTSPGGLNWQRKGLVSILERLHQGDKLQIVVAHRDRLARFGFELIQWLVERNGGAGPGSQSTGRKPRIRTHRRYSRHPPILSLAGSTDSAATARLSKRIRVYPNREQKKTVKLWFDAARWRYNQTIETLRQPDTTANWKKIKTPIIKAIPSHLAPAPYQVKSIAVRDACKAVSNAKIFNTGLKKDQAAGIRLDETFAEPGFRSRKDPHQNSFIPAKAVCPEGPYPKLLGTLKMVEATPEIHRDSRLTLHNGNYYLSIPTPASCDVEDIPDRRQARVAALDPGIRSFMTWYSETDTGHIGRGAFGRIQRLCQHLDDLISRTAKAPRSKRPNMRKAAQRMRNRIQNLIQELHHQTARFLVDRFDLILLPTFETQDMSRRGGRKLRSKSVRSLLTFAHYRFQRFLLWKAWQTGAKALLVNEAYTSKTCSWSGEIVPNLGGAKTNHRQRRHHPRPRHQRSARSVPPRFGRYPRPRKLRGRLSNECCLRSLAKMYW